MIGLDKLKMDKFISQKLAAIDEGAASRRLRGYAIAIYNEAIERVPQYSGHMAANLRISVNGSPVEYSDEFYTKDWREIDEPKQRGDIQAIETANAYNSWVNSYTGSIRDTYEIKYADGAESDYFLSVESGSTDLRDVNQPSNAILLGAAYAKRKYGRNLRTKAELEGLKI